MERHQLAVDIPDTLTPCILRIVDASIYSDVAPVECGKLQITPPGFSTSYNYTDLQPGFLVNLSACDIELQTVNCGNVYNDFPDGVYVIRYSVSPQDTVYVEYNHLRVTAALNKINNLLCCLDVKGCDPQQPLRDKLREVQLLQTMLKAAKAKVEYCHTPGQGMEIYNYVMNRLNKLACGCGCDSCN
jgi:hypothetical protein